MIDLVNDLMEVLVRELPPLVAFDRARQIAVWAPELDPWLDNADEVATDLLGTIAVARVDGHGGVDLDDAQLVDLTCDALRVISRHGYLRRAAADASMLQEVEERIFAGSDAARRMLKDALAPSALRERLAEPL